jgi:hypothetical protein
MPANTTSQGDETLQLIRKEMENIERRRSGDQDTASHSSDEGSPLSQMTDSKEKKKKKKKDKDSKSKDPDKKKKKKTSKKRSEQSAGEEPEDVWDQPKGTSLLDDDAQNEEWGVMRGSVLASDADDFAQIQRPRQKTHQFAVDFDGVDFSANQLSFQQRTQSLNVSSGDDGFDDFNPRLPSRTSSHHSDNGRQQFGGNSRGTDGFGQPHPRGGHPKPPRRVDADEQSAFGWVIDDTNRGAEIDTYNSRRTSELPNFAGSHGTVGKTTDASEDDDDDDEIDYDDTRSRNSRSRVSVQQPYTGGYVGDYSSQNGDDDSRGHVSRGVVSQGNLSRGNVSQGNRSNGTESWGGKSYLGPPFGEPGSYRGGPRGANPNQPRPPNKGQQNNGPEIFYDLPPSSFDDAYFNGVAPDRVGDLIGEENFDDERSINSDLTGLTGAFSVMPDFEDRFGENEDDGLPEVAPLAYPEYDKAVSQRIAAQRQERKQELDNRGPRAVNFGVVEIRHYERILGDNPRYVHLAASYLLFLLFLLLM